MVERKEYLAQLWEWKDEHIIKVVTGIRRCGKSVLLEQFKDRLHLAGVEAEQIISINFEDLEFEELLDYKVLYRYIKERLCSDKMTYIFLDEIQKVDKFEEVVNSLRASTSNTSIFITGSNSKLLSNELSFLVLLNLSSTKT